MFRQKQWWTARYKMAIRLMDMPKRLGREFLLPLVVALAWTYYNVISKPEWTVTFALNVLGGSFFFSAWITGQYFRISKQRKVENNLASIEATTGKIMEVLEKRTSDLVTSVESRTKNLLDHLTGGDSYPIVRLLIPSGNGAPQWLISIEGEHPLSDLEFRVVDVVAFSRLTTYKVMNPSDSRLELKWLLPNRVAFLSDPVKITTEVVDGFERASFNIFGVARNGGFVQNLWLARIPGGEWQTAWRVCRESIDLQNPYTLLGEAIPETFPIQLPTAPIVSGRT